MLRRSLILIMAAAAWPAYANVVQVAPTFETEPVATAEDAADDPAFWLHPDDPSKSLILGTDKKGGLYVYDLEGRIVQFLEGGAPNNVDVRQNMRLGDWAGDLAVASDRADDTVALFSVDETGVAKISAFPAGETEPYGICMGRPSANEALVFVTYKTGLTRIWRLTDMNESAEFVRDLSFGGQLEGCVYDDEFGILYIGEEERGIWRLDLAAGVEAAPMLVDEVGGKTGLAMDVEGLAIYRAGSETGYLIASSQGNDSYTVYRREGDNRFLGRFVIGPNGDIDGAEETDGVEAVSAPLGAAYPEGIFIVQDGYNMPAGPNQNFKVVDWRAIADALGLDD